MDQTQARHDGTAAAKALDGGGGGTRLGGRGRHPRAGAAPRRELVR
jgi:hypothetical protein